MKRFNICTSACTLFAAVISFSSALAQPNWVPNWGYITHPGMVGVGVNPPLDQLHVQGNGGWPFAAMRLSLNTTMPVSCMATSQFAMSHVPAGGFSNIATLGDLVIRTMANPVDPHVGICAQDIILSAQTPYGGIRFATEEGTKETEKMTILWNGNVGIGTSTPQALFHARGNTMIFEGDGTLYGGAASPEILIKQTGENDYWAIIKRSASWGPTADHLLFSYKDVETSPSYTETWNPSFEMHRNGNAEFHRNVGIGAIPANPGAGSDLLHVNGKTRIGGAHPVNPGHSDYLLSVDGKLVAREIVCTVSNWADHVFTPDYNLMPLGELEAQIRETKHLPGIPSEQEAISNGVNMNEMQVKLLQKIEELTLYIIEQEKNMQAMQTRLETLENK